MSERTNFTVGPATILFFIFLTLKLTGTIAWSWWWVAAPLWIPLGVGVLALSLLVLLCWRMTRTPEGRAALALHDYTEALVGRTRARGK